MDTTKALPTLGGNDLLYQIADYTLATYNSWESPWTRLTLSGAWVDYVGGGGYRQGLFARRSGTNIQINGMIKSGAAGSTICSLPANFKPGFSFMQICEANAPGTLATIFVDGSTGSLTYRSGPGAPSYLSINITVPIT